MRHRITINVDVRCDADNEHEIIGTFVSRIVRSIEGDPALKEHVIKAPTVAEIVTVEQSTSTW